MPTRKVVAPTFRFPVGKAKLAPDIVKHIPKCGRKFIDVFAGRCNITFRAIAEGLDYQDWLVNDINMAPFIRAIRDFGDQFKVSEKSKSEFDRLAELAKQGDPHALLMEPYLCYNGGTYDGGGSTTEGGRRTAESYEKNVRLACKLLREKNVRITALDWLDCLKAEKLGSDDFVMVDGPYLDAEVGCCSAESICSTELIEYLQSAKFSSAFTEYRQPLYLAAFGVPIFQKKMQLRAPNFKDTKGQGYRIECLWTNLGKSGAKRDTVTVPSQPVPDARTDSYYVELPQEELLREIKQCVAQITASRNHMNKEMRKRLLPALIELKKRTYRKHPGYYDTLAAMGLNAATVRQWFHRSYTADEVISLTVEEEEKTQSTTRKRENERSLDTVKLLLEHSDKMATAILDDKIKYAKKLATLYFEARNENRDLI